jgi:putative flippase GtrA
MSKLVHVFSHRIPRFAVVGIANAAVSLGLLNLLFFGLNFSKIAASLVSTACAVLCSFWLNRNFVFADKSKRAHQQILPFVLITLSGTLGVLNLVYISSVALLEHHSLWIVQTVHMVTGLHLAQSLIEINLSTVIGAIVAMIWNYNGYKLFVFKDAGHTAIVQDELSAARS